jgi:hypothetical protein
VSALSLIEYLLLVSVLLFLLALATLRLIVAIMDRLWP